MALAGDIGAGLDAPGPVMWTVTGRLEMANQVGTNVAVEVKGEKLIITCDLKEEHGTSGSGKSKICATTGGNVAIPGTGKVLGLNLYEKIGGK